MREQLPHRSLTSVPFDLLETMRWMPLEGWYLLERHLARAEASARHFGFPFSERHTRDALDRAVQPSDHALRVRLLIAADGSVRVEQTRLSSREGVWRVRLAAHPIDPADEFLYHKTTNRAVYERAHRPDCDDVILM